MTPANILESRYLERAIEGVEASRLYADKGSASAGNRAILKKKSIKSGIMYTAHKHKPLGHWQKLFNKLVSKSNKLSELLKEDSNLPEHHTSERKKYSDSAYLRRSFSIS